MTKRERHAMPIPSTIRTQATCAMCAGTIEQTMPGSKWWHVDTGEEKCKPQPPVTGAIPLRSV